MCQQLCCRWQMQSNPTHTYPRPWQWNHYDDVTMSRMASQITSLTIVYSTVYPGVDQRKHQSPASLPFVRGIHRRPVNSPHKCPVTRKLFPFDDVITNDVIMCCIFLIDGYTPLICVTKASLWFGPSKIYRYHSRIRGTSPTLRQFCDTYDWKSTWAHQFLLIFPHQTKTYKIEL